MVILLLLPLRVYCIAAKFLRLETWAVAEMHAEPYLRKWVRLYRLAFFSQGIYMLVVPSVYTGYSWILQDLRTKSWFSFRREWSLTMAPRFASFCTFDFGDSFPDLPRQSIDFGHFRPPKFCWQELFSLSTTRKNVIILPVLLRKILRQADTNHHSSLIRSKTFMTFLTYLTSQSARIAFLSQHAEESALSCLMQGKRTQTANAECQALMSWNDKTFKPLSETCCYMRHQLFRERFVGFPRISNAPFETLRVETPVYPCGTTYTALVNSSGKPGAWAHRLCGFETRGKSVLYHLAGLGSNVSTHE